jgi:hypothetical protein
MQRHLRAVADGDLSIPGPGRPSGLLPKARAHLQRALGHAPDALGGADREVQHFSRLTWAVGFATFGVVWEKPIGTG